MSTRFANKICIVTGAGSGIGKAVAMQLASEGGRVLVFDLNEQRGNATAQEIGAAKGEVLFLRGDAGNPADIQAAVKLAVDRWGRIDVVVNDAAMMTFQPIVELPDESWDKVLNVNLRSVFLFCKYSVPHMPPGGAIVNISSVHAHATTMGNDYYATNENLIHADGSISQSGEIFGYYPITHQYFQRYKLPVMHTETNYDEPQAVTWLGKEWANVHRLWRDGVPLIGFTWYSLQDQVDWDTGLREDNGRVNPIGLCDLDRHIRPVGHAYKNLIEVWSSHLSAENHILTVCD